MIVDNTDAELEFHIPQKGVVSHSAKSGALVQRTGSILGIVRK